MSYVFVDTGQCGNQLGCSILDSLHQHLQHDPSHIEAFFRTSYTSRDTKRYARAVSIDTEPKVINECLQRVKDKKSWLFDPRSVVYRHGGAGNNWALGYEMMSGEFLEASLDCIRRELEMCNRPPSLVITHSVAGGTGSGCGTKITEAAADEFTDVTRMNLIVTPYHFGEVVVQHFNTVLCLSKVSAASHGVITFENEVAKQLCIEMKGIERPTIHDINDVIAANIVPALLPKYSPEEHSSGIFSTISDDVTDLCSHPGLRFLSVKNVPQTLERSVEFTYDSWSSLVDTLQRMNQRGTFSERGTGSTKNITPTKGVGVGGQLQGVLKASVSSSSPSSSSPFSPSSSSSATAVAGGAGAGSGTSSESEFRSLKSILTLRGPDAATGLVTLYDSKKAAANSYVPYNRSKFNVLPNIFDDSSWSVRHSAHIINGYKRSAVLLSNSQSILPILQRSALKGADMFRVGAYVHQYGKCGLEEDDFVRAFRTVGQIIQNYRAL